MLQQTRTRKNLGSPNGKRARVLVNPSEVASITHALVPAWYLEIQIVKTQDSCNLSSFDKIVILVLISRRSELNTVCVSDNHVRVRKLWNFEVRVIQWLPFRVDVSTTEEVAMPGREAQLLDLPLKSCTRVTEADQPSLFTDIVVSDEACRLHSSNFFRTIVRSRLLFALLGVYLTKNKHYARGILVNNYRHDAQLH